MARLFGRCPAFGARSRVIFGPSNHFPSLILFLTSCESTYLPQRHKHCAVASAEIASSTVTSPFSSKKTSHDINTSQAQLIYVHNLTAFRARRPARSCPCRLSGIVKASGSAEVAYVHHPANSSRCRSGRLGVGRDPGTSKSRPPTEVEILSRQASEALVGRR